MKRLLSAILASTLAVTLLSACTQEKPPENSEPAESVNDPASAPSEEETNREEDNVHTLYFKDSNKSNKATVTFFNSLTGKSEDVEMRKCGEDNDSVTFSCEGDTSVYNMAYFTYGEKKTEKIAFNKCVSGWCIANDGFFPYTEGEDIDLTPRFDEATLKGYGYDKMIRIWKPDDYDEKSEEKYSTIYVLDGHTFADFGREYREIEKHAGVIEQVRSAIKTSGEKIIVVAIDNEIARDHELEPDLEEKIHENENDLINAETADEDADYEGMSATQFAYFTVNRLVPYVREHYNVYYDARHTAITGNSLGGLESFYISMEYPDVFGTIGSFSPSFLFFEDEQWETYLDSKKFTDDSPMLYFYTGPAEKDTDPFVTNMYNRLKEKGYSENKLLLHYNEEGTHSNEYWRSVLSEFLCSMIYGSVEPLKQ